MRNLAWLLILAGIGLAVGLPWLQTGFSGNEIVSFRIFERGDES